MPSTPLYSIEDAVADCVAEITEAIADRYEVRMKAAARRQVHADLRTAIEQGARIADARYAASLGRVAESWENER